MKSFFDEFKKFILRGNVMDMAVGVIIGAAFQAIVTSLVNDIISPIIGLIANTDMSYLVWTVGDVEIRYGAFITAIINFIIMAFVIFTIVRTINKVADSHKKPEAPAAPTTKVCPYCKSEIAIDATKCPHCTSELEK
ncbi:MAG: large conductance mechanosensitive channel protein MscL [Lachnospiraceae bacterium]|nr:large conductance mechanosensitive channel protein MscL [Lachnospiraceae bacterium]